MSFRICSVIGIGLEASGDTYLVKMLTASRSIPGRGKEKGMQSEIKGGGEINIRITLVRHYLNQSIFILKPLNAAWETFLGKKKKKKKKNDFQFHKGDTERADAQFDYGFTLRFIALF